MINAIFTAAALAATVLAAPQSLSRRGFGGVTLMNNCPNTVYTYTYTGADGLVHQSNGIAPGEWYWEPYQRPVAPNGATIKLGTAQDGSGAITQLEYSFTDANLWYDISNVNCGPTSQSSTAPCPFLNGGMFMRVDNPACATAMCASGDTDCHDAYNLPDDNWATHGCEYGNANIVLFMCSSVSLG